MQVTICAKNKPIVLLQLFFDACGFSGMESSGDLIVRITKATGNSERACRPEESSNHEPQIEQRFTMPILKAQRILLKFWVASWATKAEVLAEKDIETLYMIESGRRKWGQIASTPNANLGNGTSVFPVNTQTIACHFQH